MTPANLAGQFGDTTYTKVFVGGLAWETQKDTMKNYFEQFGDILEAVVITDKTTGRSKGYGFVTFKEADAAMRACVDAAPVIDGRRANCNLASLGVQRSKPSTPKNGGVSPLKMFTRQKICFRKKQDSSFHAVKERHAFAFVWTGGGGRNIRVVGGFHQGGFQAAAAAGGGGVGAAFASAATFPHHYSVQQGIPYNLYGYTPYSAEYAYPTSYYGMYGANTQYQLYGSGNNGLVSGAAAAAAAAYYPYLNFNEGNGGATGYSASQGGYGFQYPNHLFQYSTGLYPQQYGTPVSLAPQTPLQSGMTMTLRAPIPHR